VLAPCPRFSPTKFVGHPCAGPGWQWIQLARSVYSAVGRCSYKAPERSALAIPSHSGHQHGHISPSDLLKAMRHHSQSLLDLWALSTAHIHSICFKDHLGFPASLLTCSRRQSATAYSCFYGSHLISFCRFTLRSHGFCFYCSNGKIPKNCDAEFL
jgi:hypothetical protein